MTDTTAPQPLDGETRLDVKTMFAGMPATMLVSPYDDGTVVMALRREGVDGYITVSVRFTLDELNGLDRALAIARTSITVHRSTARAARMAAERDDVHPIPDGTVDTPPE